MTIEDTYYKYFLLGRGGSVYGVISETDLSITVQWLGNKGDGKFYSMQTIHDRKHYFMDNIDDVTRDYAEAYEHMMKWKALKALQIKP